MAGHHMAPGQTLVWAGKTLTDPSAAAVAVIPGTDSQWWKQESQKLATSAILVRITLKSKYIMN